MNYFCNIITLMKDRELIFPSIIVVDLVSLSVVFTWQDVEEIMTIRLPSKESQPVLSL